MSAAAAAAPARRSASAPARGATRQQLLARLHCLKKEQGWDEETYRAILQARTGRRSAAELDGAALARLIAQLAPAASPAAAARRAAANEWAWVDSAASARQPLLRKLIMLAKSAGIRRGGQVRYIEGIAQQMSGGIQHPLRLCDEVELWRIAAALSKQVQRHAAAPR